MKKNVIAAEFSKGERTICEHINVQQPDGSIARFNCLVLSQQQADAPQKNGGDIFALESPGTPTQTN